MHIIEAYPNNSYSYPIYICSDIEIILSGLQKHLHHYSKIILFVDAYIKEFQSTDEILTIFNNYNCEETEVIIFPLKPGKQSKNLQTIEKLAQWLLKHNVQRDSLFISVGGGVIGDLIGFLSSIYFRGVSLAHIPTNLLSMTDSAIGGKTAVNTSCHVNTLGTYKHPVFIIIYTGFLRSLPQRDILAGFAEILKVSLLREGDLLKKIIHLTKEQIISREMKLMEEILSLSIKYKLHFTEDDITEKNKRLFLNLGHTFGHAIESLQDLKTEEYYRHGEAVSLGMVSCLYLSDKIFQTNNINILERLLKNFGLPMKIPNEYLNKLNISRGELLNRLTEIAMQDKKGKKNKLNLILLQDIYTPVIYSTDNHKIIKEAFEKLF
tara:strand:+ start:46 stop:1182 length:1137 start_codon:yes stop_codon:yes gene_type:complete